MPSARNSRPSAYHPRPKGWRVRLNQVGFELIAQDLATPSVLCAIADLEAVIEAVVAMRDDPATQEHEPTHEPAHPAVAA